MAVINKIRKYSGLAVTFIGISIAAFVFTDLFVPKGGGYGAQREIGSINGVTINADEFDAEVQRIRASQPNQPDEAIRDLAWNTLVFKYAYRDQIDALGVTVSDDELTEMVQGDSLFIHPWMRQQFVDPNTQQFSKDLVINFLQRLDAQPSVEQIASWDNFQSQMRRDRLMTKYTDLMRLSNYVTELEAERQYKLQTDKAKIKYLFVPYASVPDSVAEAEVTDQRLQEYLNENVEKYKSEATRSLNYVVFGIDPSKEDSTLLFEEMQQIASDFATAADDSTFAIVNSDVPSAGAFQPLNRLPKVIFSDNLTIEEGKVYGPYLDGNTYKVYKVVGKDSDTAQVATRASHILFKTEGMTDDKKAEIRQKANEVLQEIKGGADFAEKAKQYGEDGTKDRGGDLGFFGKGEMVGPFQKASFDKNEAGLVNNLVETRFGYHIVKVTVPKSDDIFKLQTIIRNITPGEDTRNEFLLRAEEFRLSVNSLDDFREQVEADSLLRLETAEKLASNSVNLGQLTDAREVIRWAFNEAGVGDVSEVKEVKDKYVIAALFAKSEKDEPNLDVYREEVKQEVIKEIKAEIIKKKVKADAKTLEEMREQYGELARVDTVEVSLNAFSLGNTGANSVAVGKSLGLKKKGDRTDLFSDQMGVFMIELEANIPASSIADYTQYKEQLQTPLDGRTQFLIDQAIKDASAIKDERYKFY